jgi:hypothetical protein
MKKIKSILACIAIALILTWGCSKKADNPTEKIAGTANKTWHPVKETNASGDKEKLTETEKNETWTFYTNGTLSMNLTDQSIKGSWGYNVANKTLTITPDDGSGARQFAVENLSDDNMKLRAGDGSEMKLEAED